MLELEFSAEERRIQTSMTSKSIIVCQKLPTKAYGKIMNFVLNKKLKTKIKQFSKDIIFYTLMICFVVQIEYW